MRSRLFPAIVLLVLGFVLVQITKPYLHGWKFQQLVQREVDSGRDRAEAGAVHQRVLEEGRAMGFIIRDDDVQVERLVRGYQVRVHYSVPVDFKVYRSAVAFDFAARTSDTVLSE
jgi:hypothetical protein